jgi:AcrR family transcriptional regulator
MPQILKEEIRERIRESALNEFYARGFNFATMKDIAANAGIPTGLIYSYFSDKEDLFERIVQPALDCIRAIVHGNRISEVPGENLLQNEMRQFLACMETYQREMVVLIDKSAGSRLSGIKDEIIREVTAHVKNTPLMRGTAHKELFYHILATNFMEGCYEIARHYVDKEWAETMLGLLIKQHLYGVSGLCP